MGIILRTFINLVLKLLLIHVGGDFDSKGIRTNSKQEAFSQTSYGHHIKWSFNAQQNNIKIKVKKHKYEKLKD